jgi:hypothetical protein
MSDLCQFISIVGYGRSPSKGGPKWANVSDITREGARVPGAANHVRYASPPHVLHGGCPLEAGRLAIERANHAYDYGEKRRLLRCNGWAMLAGVASYPTPRHVVESDPTEQEIYLRWRAMTILFLIHCFGEHLKSVVEHADETQLHLHFYVVPALLADEHLNMRDIHPGLRMKLHAAEAGACQKFQDAAYRSGLSRWQDDFWWEVSRHFAHTRFGPRRMRVSRLQRLMERRMAEENARQKAALAADRARFNQEAAERRADLERDRAKIDSITQGYEKANGVLRAGCLTLKARADAERAGRQAAEAEVERLRTRVAELERDLSLSPVA